MIIPSFAAVIDELKNLESNKRKPIAQIATQLLTKFTELAPHRAINLIAIDQLTDTIQTQIQQPNQNKQLTQTCYHMLLILGHLYPRNAYQDGQPLDALSLNTIPDQHLFISMHRYQWDILELTKYFKTQSAYICPVTKILFTSMDIATIRSIAKDLNITVELLNTNQPPIVGGETQACCPCLLFSFFSRNNRRPAIPERTQIDFLDELNVYSGSYVASSISMWM